MAAARANHHPSGGKSHAVQLRPAEARDADTVIRFMRALEEADPGPSPFDETRRRACFEQLLEKPAFGRLWLICVRGEPVGYIVLTVGFSFEYGGHDAFVDELYVAPEHRRQGIGRKAVEFLEAHAAETGVRAVHLEVTHGNDAAMELYMRCGYASHDRHLMTKRLEHRRATQSVAQRGPRS